MTDVVESRQLGILLLVRTGTLSMNKVGEASDQATSTQRFLLFGQPRTTNLSSLVQIVCPSMRGSLAKFVVLVIVAPCGHVATVDDVKIYPIDFENESCTLFSQQKILWRSFRRSKISVQGSQKLDQRIGFDPVRLELFSRWC